MQLPVQSPGLIRVLLESNVVPGGWRALFPHRCLIPPPVTPEGVVVVFFFFFFFFFHFFCWRG